MALAVLSSLLASTAVCELVLRALGRSPRVSYRGGTPEAHFWISDRNLGFRNRPLERFENESFGTTVRTGAFGARLGTRWTDDPKKPLVVFVGDSTTFCAETNDDETGPSEVAKRLPGTLDVGVVNAGVRGYNTVQAVRMAQEWLARAPVRLVVYTYCDNDYIENLDPISYWPATAPAYRSGKDGLVAIEPSFQGAEGEPLAAIESPRVSIARGLVRSASHRSALAAGLADLVRFEESPSHALPDGTVGCERWPAPTFIRWADEHGGEAVLAMLVRGLADSCKARGALLLVTRYTNSTRGWYPWLTEPKVRDHNPHDRLARACAAANVPCVDLSPAFTDEPRSYMAVLLDGHMDPHYGRKGTRTYGGALAPHVAALLSGAR